MPNRKKGNARRDRRTAQQPAQRPGVPTLHLAEVAAPPLPPARRMPIIKDVFDRFLERLRRRSPAPGVQSPAAGAVDGVDETKIGAEQKPQRENQAYHHRARQVRAAADAPAAAMLHPPPFPPVMVNDDPYQNKDRYEEFCNARLGIADDTEICTICFFEETWRWPRGGEKPRSNMIFHFNRVHEIGGVKCDKELCDVRFRSEEHRRLHVSYCTEIWKENPQLRHKRFCKGTREDC